MKSSIKIKEHLLSKCKEGILVRRNIINNHISDIQAALQSESKSSAGDKHETGRAMLQLEREKLGQQLAETEEQETVLNRISLIHRPQTITLGSAVITSLSNYFIAISAGEIEVENSKYYAISMSTPIAKLLIGKKVGDMIVFNHQEINIQEVL